MRTTTPAESLRSLFILWYGQSKMFKTSLALMAPAEWRPIDYLDADNGAAIRLRLLGMTKEERVKAGIAPSSAYEMAGPWVKEDITLYQPEQATYYSDLWAFATEITPRSKSKTIVVDTLSRIGDEVLREVKTTPLTVKDKQKEDNRPKIITSGVETVHPTQADFGVSQDRIMEFLLALHDRNPDKNIILISHEKTGEIKVEGGGGRVLAGPRSIGNALIETIPAIVDVALRFEPKLATVVVEKGGKKTVEQQQTVAIRTRNHNIYIAGDRSGVFEDGETLNPPVFWTKLQQIVSMAM